MTTLSPGSWNDQTFSSIIVLDKAAKRSNIVHNWKCWMKMFDQVQTFSFNILYDEQCLIVWPLHPTPRWMKNDWLLSRGFTDCYIIGVLQPITPQFVILGKEGCEVGCEVFTAQIPVFFALFPQGKMNNKNRNQFSFIAAILISIYSR